MTMSPVKRFSLVRVPKLEGEVARIKLIKGPDVGLTFVIFNPPFTVGRGEENNIVLSDIKSSRSHVRILVEGNYWIVEDNGSSNGFLINTLVAKRGRLKHGDHLYIGESVLEFLETSPVPVSESVTQFLKNPISAELPSAQPMAMTMGVAPSANPNKKRIIMYSVMGVVGAIAFFYEPPKRNGGLSATQKNICKFFGIPCERIGAAEGQKQVEERKLKLKEAMREMTSFTSEAKDDQFGLTKEAQIFFAQGVREFREQNFLRAKEFFSNVLLIDPSHQSSRRYILRCDEENDRMIKRTLDLARKYRAIGRLRAAQAQYRLVLQLRADRPDDTEYLEAKEQDKIIEDLLNNNHERAPAGGKP